MIDINCDLGESIAFLQSGHDEALMNFINSANIACGFHAGDEYIMAKTIENALKYDLNIGAHPGFKDEENFGRIEVEMSENEIEDLISKQLNIIHKIAGNKLHHVKPHGALYNMAAKRKDYAEAIAKAVFSFNPQLITYGLSGSESIKAAEVYGLRCYSEVFADRAYTKEGSLASRNIRDSVLEDFSRIESQVNNFIKGNPIETIDGSTVQLKVQTICIHSDSPNALEIAKTVWSTVRLFQ